ncbi:MAG: NUDIX domain-containing protein [Pseudomonadota bacterium]
MERVFLYGTLRYAPLLKFVLGEEGAASPATLKGHGVFHAGQESYPRLGEAAGEVQGLLVEGAEAAARIAFYEAVFGYRAAPVTVEVEGAAVTAHAFLAGEGVPAAGAEWSLEAWIDAWGDTTLHFAREVMGQYGSTDAKHLRTMTPTMKARAWARTLAQETKPPPLGAPPSTAPEVIAERRPYINFFSLCEADLRPPRFEGGLGRAVSRAAFIGFDAAVVLPYDPVRDRVHLIEQFRMAPFFRGDPQRFLVEAVAGGVDPGERPEAAAFREAREEADLELRALHLVSKHYPSSSSFTEYLYVYVGIADLPDGAAKLGGLSTEEEDIKGHVLDYGRFAELLDADAFNVGPLILAGHWLARHRDRLRREA